MSVCLSISYINIYRITYALYNVLVTCGEPRTEMDKRNTALLPVGHTDWEDGHYLGNMAL